MSDRLLEAAARLPPPELQSLHAIHLATAQQLGVSLARVVTDDERIFAAAAAAQWITVAPS